MSKVAGFYIRSTRFSRPPWGQLYVLFKRGFNAGEMVNSVAHLAEGRGGGKPNIAQAGIKAPEKLADALAKAPDIVRNKLAN